MSNTKKVAGGGGRVEKGREANSERVAVKQEKFVGRTEALAGYVFDTTTAWNADNYTKTLKEIARHVGSTSKHGADLRWTIEDETLFVITRPAWPTALATGASPDETGAHEIDMDIYREDVKTFVKRRSTLDDNMGRAFEIVWGQCTQAMRAKVEAQANY